MIQKNEISLLLKRILLGGRISSERAIMISEYFLIPGVMADRSSGKVTAGSLFGTDHTETAISVAEYFFFNFPSILQLCLKYVLQVFEQLGLLEGLLLGRAAETRMELMIEKQRALDRLQHLLAERYGAWSSLKTVGH